MVTPEVRGIDLFRIANWYISGWIPSLKAGTAVRQPFSRTTTMHPAFQGCIRRLYLLSTRLTMTAITEHTEMQQVAARLSKATQARQFSFLPMLRCARKCNVSDWSRSWWQCVKEINPCHANANLPLRLLSPFRLPHCSPRLMSTRWTSMWSRPLARRLPAESMWQCSFVLLASSLRC